ncbi:hypothetical protein DPMN_140227 [Dreissena polymorpha]|uniref:Ig-like domain-containing protein n=1 Tax=Dreissena polymorpha TaxID=45954 RepID=A0A9D4G7S6_DREPO|nr:hypothetical protein DPMN_140227 [Dreissena polymorpha]
MDFSVVYCICFIIELFVLKGYKASPTLTVEVNDAFVNSSITFTCSTSSPPEAVVWFMSEEGSEEEKKVIAQWLDADHLRRTDNNAMDCSCLSEHVYSCSIKSVISRNDGQRWRCKAFDGIEYSIIKSYIIRLIYGPGVPKITYTIPANSDALWNALHDPIKVIVGSTIILMCSVDSVPNSTYTWDTGHKGSILTIVNVTRTTNTRHNCMAKNIMDTSFKGNVIGSNYSFANLDILYGPSTIALMYNNVTPIENKFKVIEGWSFKILCSASSNPAPRYTWSGHVAQQGDALIIRNVRTDIERNVTCKAENTMTDSVGKSVVGTTLVTVSMDVLYPPDVQRLQNQTVLLNNSLTVVCNLTLVGNPPASNYSWIRKDIGRVMGTGKTIIINNIRLTDEGEYQCNANNRMQPITNEVQYGSSQSTVYINVEYGAYVREFKSNQSHNSIAVNQGETVDLLCVADGDPEPVLRVMNTTRGNESILVEIKGREAKYRIQQAQCEYDTGNYTCLADNRYNEGRQLFALLVYCKCILLN